MIYNSENSLLIYNRYGNKAFISQRGYGISGSEREKELSLDVIMESIRERALNGFDYWMTFGVVTEKEEKFLRDNRYRISRFGNGCVQVYWKPKQA